MTNRVNPPNNKSIYNKSMKPFSIAGIQTYIGTHDNTGAICSRVDLTMHIYPWVEMILLSELAMFGPVLTNSQTLPCPAEEAYQEIAAKHGIWLIPGSLFERADGVIYNTIPVISPTGEIIDRYRKMFPFVPYEQGVKPGNEFCLFDIEGAGRFAVTNCYDIWFPETTRTLTAMGAEVLLHPVLTTLADRDVDLNIAKASAAIFQCYVFDINGLGAGGNGQSCVIGPDGRVLFQAGSHEQIIPIEIDFDQVRRQRERGIRGLGQPLKSFRDRTVDFAVYDRKNFNNEYLESLGKLEKPKKQHLKLKNS